MPPPVECDPSARHVEAVARMLASESSKPDAQIITGWITVQANRTWFLSVFRLLTGKSRQYGHPKHFLPVGSQELHGAKQKTTETSKTTKARTKPMGS
jgi:hypothetical protein